ncbi:MAG: hypothetical protein ACFCVH_04575 [Alphaproteobacteria bacterium]
MTTDETIRVMAAFIVLQHRLQAPRVAAEIVAALDHEPGLRRDWVQITRQVWRMLHARAAAEPAARRRRMPQ